ncbi:hypothetical protein [Staphylococcus gallinarum]|uniref:hypothetical protein n=1 Tax=Staphylococcus gallinarum TaxID=1293 RepID=UPI0030C48C2D
MRYRIYEYDEPLKESNSIVSLFDKWIDFEILNIENNMLDQDHFDSDFKLGNLLIDKLKNYKFSLVESNGEKHFNNVMNILNEWEDMSFYGLKFYKI